MIRRSSQFLWVAISYYRKMKKFIDSTKKKSKIISGIDQTKQNDNLGELFRGIKELW